MATIIDPDGSVSVVYRDASVTVYPVNGEGVYDENPDPPHGADATLLTVYSAINVVLVTTTSTDYGVKLPQAEAGDYFEIFNAGAGPAAYIYDYSGNLILTGTARVRFDGTNWR